MKPQPHILERCMNYANDLTLPQFMDKYNFDPRAHGGIFNVADTVKITQSGYVNYWVNQIRHETKLNPKPRPIPDNLRILQGCLEHLAILGIRASVTEVRTKQRQADKVFLRTAVVVYLFSEGYRLTKIGKIVNRSPAAVKHMLDAICELQPYQVEFIKKVAGHVPGDMLTGPLIAYHQNQINLLTGGMNE